MATSSNLTWHDSAITKQQRQAALKQTSFVLWFTGLSGSGKSTLSVALEQHLFEQSYHVYRLDGDNIRHGLNNNLGFSPADRTENIRRIGEVSKLFVDAGIIVLTAFISPYRADRDLVRAMLGGNEFVEVHVECSVQACEQRDIKGLYAKARAGAIKDFTGISAPYEAPLHPEITIQTEQQDVATTLTALVQALRDQGYLKRP